MRGRQLLASSIACLAVSVFAGCTSGDDRSGAPTTTTPSSPTGCDLATEIDLDSELTPATASELRQAFESDENALASVIAARLHAAAQADVEPSDDDVALLDRMCSDGYLPVLAEEYSPALSSACTDLLRAVSDADPAAVVAPLTSIAEQAGAVSSTLATDVLSAQGTSGFPEGSEWESLNAACDELPGVEQVPTTTTTAPAPAPIETATTPAPPPATAPTTTECHGASGCAFDNWIDLDALQAELAADLSSSGAPTSPDQIDCSQGAAPNRVAVGERFFCVVPFEVHTFLYVFE